MRRKTLGLPLFQDFTKFDLHKKMNRKTYYV